MSNWMRVQSGMARSCGRPMHQRSPEMQASLWTFQQRHCLSLMHFSCIGLIITSDTICNLVIREAPQSCSVSHITHSCRIYQNIWSLFILLLICKSQFVDYIFHTLTLLCTWVKGRVWKARYSLSCWELDEKTTLMSACKRRISWAWRLEARRRS